MNKKRTSAGLRELRILFGHGGKVRRAAKIVFTKRDASIYIFVYGVTGAYYYGLSDFGENETKHTFNYKSQFGTSELPKLSIHESGDVHIYHQKENLAGPLQTLPLRQFQGEHLASITFDSFDGLPEHFDPLKPDGPERDLILDTENKAQGGRIVLYANAIANKFPIPCLITATMQRKHLRNPIYVGFAIIGQQKIRPAGKQGTTVLAGWDPRKDESNRQDFLFLRAE